MKAFAISRSIFGERACSGCSRPTIAFRLKKKPQADRKNPNVQEWEELMWRFQKALPDARPGEEWLLMERIVLEK
jgi:hypothetical protein